MHLRQEGEIGVGSEAALGLWGIRIRGLMWGSEEDEGGKVSTQAKRVGKLRLSEISK